MSPPPSGAASALHRALSMCVLNRLSRGASARTNACERVDRDQNAHPDILRNEIVENNENVSPRRQIPCHNYFPYL
eukprot:199705-Pleurochrysis_carterae.AAC.1